LVVDTVGERGLAASRAGLAATAVVDLVSPQSPGHQQSQLRPGDKRTHLLSGWSEKLLDLVRDLEAEQQPSANAPAGPVPAATLPVIEVLRQRYRQ
jgi:hypothetical protein